MAQQEFKRGVGVAPCLNCERSGCGSYHDHCEKYREYVKHKKSISAARTKENEFRDTVYSAKRRMKTAHGSKFKVTKSSKK